MGSKETLREVAQETVRGWIEGVARLSQRTSEEFSGSNSPAVEETMANLRMIGRFAQAAEATLKEDGKIIFPDHEEVTAPLVVEEGAEAEVTPEAGEKQPETFSGLLRMKIEEVLPPQESFTIDEFTGFLTSKKDLERAIGGLGLGDRNTFNREEVSNLLERVLTTPTNPRFRPKETYGVSDLIRSFASLRQSELDKWGKQIGWSFKEHPAVGLDEALAIRGLAALERVTAKKQ